jgi:hypothetical protein
MRLVCFGRGLWTHKVHAVCFYSLLLKALLLPKCHAPITVKDIGCNAKRRLAREDETDCVSYSEMVWLFAAVVWPSAVLCSLLVGGREVDFHWLLDAAAAARPVNVGGSGEVCHCHDL